MTGLFEINCCRNPVVRLNTVVFHDDTHTGIPSEDGVIIGRRLQFLCPFIEFHGFTEQRIHHVSGTGCAIWLRIAWARRSRTVPEQYGCFIFVAECGHRIPRFVVTSGTFSKLVRQQQDQFDLRLGVLRIEVQAVPTNPDSFSSR